MPPINYHLLIFHHVTKLGLPLTIYEATHKLAASISIRFNFPLFSTPRLSFSLSPEIQLACLIIIAVKLAHPFTGTPRLPTSFTDPAIFKMNWEVWKSIMKNPDRGKKKADGSGLVKGKEITVTEDEAFRMNGKEVDDYMAWYERTFIEGDDDEHKFPDQILRLFPLQKNTSASDPQPQNTPGELTSSIPASMPPKIKNMHKYLEYQKPVPQKEGALLPGSRYFQWRTVPELPENAKAFYEVVASQTSVSLESLTHAVFTVERKLDEWALAERRKEVTGDDSDYSDGLMIDGEVG